jgi:hypothetical protein
MAGTLNLTIQAIVTNGMYSRSWAETPTIVQNNAGEASGVVTTTAATAVNLDVGGVTTLGYIMLKNLDTVNNIDFGVGSFTAFATLKPGECAIFRLKPGITLQHKPQAGTPQFQYWLLQD